MIGPPLRRKKACSYFYSTRVVGLSWSAASLHAGRPGKVPVTEPAAQAATYNKRGRSGYDMRLESVSATVSFKLFSVVLCGISHDNFL